MARLLIGNIKGPQGAQGIQGPQGPVGATGPQGPMPDLVNNALATEAGVAALDAVMGKTLQDQITQQNSNLNDVSTKISGISVFQTTVPITVANGYGESTENVKKDGYRCLGMVGFQINSTYYFIYKSIFDITNETLIVGIRRPGDTSEGIFNVYVRCLYIPE